MHNRPRTPSLAPADYHGGLLRVRQDGLCLPQKLLSSIPNCAASCVSLFASTNYPGSTCDTRTDLAFLCTQDNISDLTIGEGSVQCVKSFCRGADQDNVVSYNVCAGIQGALPNLAKTITATLLEATSSSPSTMSSLTQTIGSPSATNSVSMIVMDTGSPSKPAETSSSFTTAVSASTASAPSTAAQNTTDSVAMAEQAASRDGLTTAQVAGIAVGGAGVALAVFGLLMFIFCMRKRRRERRRNQRRSRIIDATPPTTYPSPDETEKENFPTDQNALAPTTSNGRFYASPEEQPTEEKNKRRSFWRKSIKPEDIGIAVSPRVPGNMSPVSATSQQSSSRLLPTLPNQALWPAPLDIEGTKRRQYARSINGTGNIDDIESAPSAREAQAVYVDNQPFDLLPAPKKQRIAPPPLTLPMVPENPVNGADESTGRRPPAARIPLTPTYDNGNISILTAPSTFGSPPSTVASRTEHQQPSEPLPEHHLAPSSTYANRNVLRKNPPAGVPIQAMDPKIEPLEQPRVAPSPPSEKPAAVSLRPGSISSEYTEIEEDTTPEESNKELGMTAPSQTPKSSQIREEALPESPIKDLRYPTIPRSAAVSRQADYPAMPRMLPTAPNTKMVYKPNRNQLIRTRASIIQADTASSDGYLSDSTIEFPVPPRETSPLKQRATRMQPDEQRRAREPLRPSLNEVLTSQNSKDMAPTRSPSSKAKLTPSKSKTGDLYLTVSI